MKRLASVFAALALTVSVPRGADAASPVPRRLEVVPHADSLTTYAANRVDLVLGFDGAGADLISGFAEITFKERRGKKSSWSALLTAESIDTDGGTVRLTTDRPSRPSVVGAGEPGSKPACPGEAAE